MKHINTAHTDALLELINHSPYSELLEMRFCELGIGYAKLEVDLQRKHRNTFNIIHGGVYSSLIDTAAYWSIYYNLDDNVNYTSVDLSISNLSMVSEGKIIVEGNSIKIGRSICLAEATVKGENGKLIAHGTSKLMILKEKQSVNSVLAAMGCKELPSKYM